MEKFCYQKWSAFSAAQQLNGQSCVVCKARSRYTKKHFWKPSPVRGPAWEYKTYCG